MIKVSSILIALAFTVSIAWGHDSWISRGSYRSPPGTATEGMSCCGDNDCGVWTGNKGESIELKSDGYHVDATFTLPPNDAVQWKKPQPVVSFHLRQIIPESQVTPVSKDGAYWACINWGIYNNQQQEGFTPEQRAASNPVRCFFAPPPGS